MVWVQKKHARSNHRLVTLGTRKQDAARVYEPLVELAGRVDWGTTRAKHCIACGGCPLRIRLQMYSLSHSSSLVLAVTLDNKPKLPSQRIAVLFSLVHVINITQRTTDIRPDGGPARCRFVLSLSSTTETPHYTAKP